MPRAMDELRTRLETLGARLSGLRKSFEHLEEDLEHLHSGDKLVLCVDFYDMYKYLHMQGRNRITENQAADEDAVNDYVRVLLVHKSSFPIVLLPWYMQEFRAVASRRFNTYKHLEARIAEWLDRLKREISRYQVASEELRSALVNHEYKARHQERNKVAQQATILANGVKKFLSGIDELSREAGAVQRYDALVKANRIVALKEFAVGESVDFEKDVVFHAASGYLGEKRHGHTPSNEADAWAISAVGQLNLASHTPDALFLLVSGAHFVSDTVTKLATLVGKKTMDSVKLRTLDFWKLWFSLLSTAKIRRSEAQLEFWEFRDDIVPRLDSMQGAYRALARRISEGGELGTDDFGLREKLDKLAKDIEVFLESVSQPILDARWRLTIVEDTFWSIEEKDKQIEQIVEGIESSLSALEVGDESVTSLRLGRVLEELQRLEGLIGDAVTMADEVRRQAEGKLNSREMD